MQVLLIYNPRAGRGRGESAAAEVRQALAAAGHTVTLQLAGPEPHPSAPAHPPELVVVVGGDGTLHYTVDRLVPRRAAVYHVPLGTENLFAREFAMKADPARVVEAIRAWRVRDIDVGVCNGRRFTLMASVGADAGVIRRLAARRKGAIRHHHYAAPVIAELLRPTIPRLSVWVDDKLLVERKLGMVVVANSRQYALRIDPVRLADVADGVLDVVVLPASTSLGLLARVAGSRLGWPGPGVIRGRGQRVRVRAEGLKLCAQIDGETGPAAAAGGLDLDFGLEPSALRVLLGVDFPRQNDIKTP